MYISLFKEFLISNDTLRVYKDGKLLFGSTGDRLLPLMEYINDFCHDYRQVIVFDKIMGNAAALLSIKAGCQEVYSPLGSQFAIKTLDRYGIKYHVNEIVRYIQKTDGEDMCPTEKLSIDKGPEDFYEVMRRVIDGPRTEDPNRKGEL